MSRNIQRVLTAVVSFAVLVAPFATGAAVADPACGLKRGFWVTIPAPTFKTGPQRLTAYKVDAGSPARMLVTNGKAVMRTTDGACSWKQVFALPASPSAESQATAANSEIVSIDIAEGLRERIFLMIEESGPQGARPHVTKSDDFGDTWAAADVGLPVAGAPEELETPPTAPDTAYLAIDVGGGSIDLMFASTDGGQSWTLRSNPTALTPSRGIMGFEVDPIVATSLWAYGTNGMYHSADGGASFVPVDEFVGTPVNTADVFHSAGPARIAGFRPGTKDALFSANNGDTWLVVEGPALPRRTTTSVAHGTDVGDYYITADGRVYRYFAEAFTWIDLHAPRSDLVDISTDKAGGVYARSGTTIEAYVGPPDPSLTDGPLDISVVNPGRELQVGDPVLSPATKKIVLDPGESRTVRYQLDLPRTPLPLQVYFLLDTSDSMGPAIEDLADSVVDIINQLIQEDIRLQVGVGAFRAYPDRAVPLPSCDEVGANQSCEPNYVYRRIIDIGDAGPHVSDALRLLESDAGGFYKSHMGALWHLATGEGADLYPPGPEGQDVPPEQQANFRANGLRVVVHATDEAFGDDDPPREAGASDFGAPIPPEIPEARMVIDALNDKDIEHIGLSIGTAAKKDLAQIAKGTDTVAPAEGVDCGGGHFIPPGDPLVCAIKRTNFEASYNLVPAIVNTVEALPDSTDVGFTVEGNERVVGKITPTNTPEVVLQIANELPVEVTYRCPLDLAGKRFDTRLDATRLDRDRNLDSATTEIVCRAIPKDPNPPLVPFAQVFNLIAIAIPPPPPPVNISAGSQAQSQAQAQTGAVFQEEEQPQVAIAAAYREAMQEEMEFDFEMVAYEGRKDPVSAYATLGAGAALASFMYAGYMLSRQRAQLAHQRKYRRRR